MKKKIVYIDMDHVLCDYDAGFKSHQSKYPDLAFPQSQPGLYIGLEPINKATHAFQWLSTQPIFDVYILTAPSLRNPHCYMEKRLWVEQHLGFDAVKKLIISPHKGLNMGDYLIDDCAYGKGQEDFIGTLIQFGSSRYPDWEAVINYYKAKYAITE